MLSFFVLLPADPLSFFKPHVGHQNVVDVAAQVLGSCESLERARSRREPRGGDVGDVQGEACGVRLGGVDVKSEYSGKCPLNKLHGQA